MGMQPEQPGADGMEGPRPGQGRRRAALIPGPGGDALHPALHLGRRPPGEGQQQDSLGRHALADQEGDAMGQGIGLARTGPGNDEKGRGVICRGAGGRAAGRSIAQAILGGPPLSGVQILHAGKGVHGGEDIGAAKSSEGKAPWHRPARRMTARPTSAPLAAILPCPGPAFRR